MTDHMSDGYLEVISLIERLHRQVLELIKLELDRLGMHDINNVQALMLFNIGEAEISIGELISRGYYLGSNVSYNVKKMIENGYLAHERSLHDRRSIRVRLTQNGRILRDRLDEMYRRHLQMVGQTGITDADLQLVAAILREVERFWMGLADPRNE
jgi:DNA-binding MarR family transcriptional regulator